MNEYEVKGLNEIIYNTTLDNGLEVYLWNKENSHSFYSTLSVKYGSLDANFKIDKKVYNTPYGIAHFIEHLKFNIDNKTTAHDLFNTRGCETNAFTTFDYTNYQVMGNNNPVENTLLLLDFVQNSYFTKKHVNKERGIIISEANMGFDNPYMRSLYEHLRNVFKREECSKFITGDENDIKEIDVQDIENVFNTYYHPKNSFLVVTGNFNPYEMIAAIKDNQSKKDFGEYLNPIRIKKNEPKKVVKEYHELAAAVKNNKIRITAKVNLNDFKNIDIYEMMIYTKMILKTNFGDSSKFKNELLDKELIYDMSYNVNKMDEFLMLTITATTKYKEEILDRIYNKLDNLEIIEADFKRALKVLIATTILDYEDIEVVNDTIQEELIYQGKVYFDKKEIIENISYNVALEIINKINFKNRTTTILIPIKE